MNTMDEDLKGMQPPEWSDDTRMAALFGKYRPDHFDFWYPLIYETSKHLNTFTFSIKDLKKRFKRKGLVPIGFAKLFEDAREKQKFVLTNEYAVTENNNNMLGSMWRKFVKVAGNYSPLRKPAPIDDDTIFVLAPLVQERADALYAWQASHEDESTVLLYSELLASDPTLTPAALDLLIDTLHARHLATAFEVHGTRAVKFSRHSSTSPSVGSVERGVAALKYTLQLLDSQLTRVEQEVAASAAEVHKSLAAQNRRQALLHLKRKKVLQSLYDKRLTAKHNIEQVLITVHGAQSDQSVLEAYKSGVAGLKHVQANQSVDEIDATLDEWRDTVASQEELSAALTGVTDQLTAVDDAELEREYEALESEQHASHDLTPVKPTPVNTTPVTAPVKPSVAEEDELIAALKELKVNTHEPQPVRTADTAM